MPKRLAQIAVLLLTTLTMLGAGNPSNRFDRLGHNLVCQCGCGQILLECNHVGCPVSPVMIDELRTQLASALPDAGVLNFFIAKYGAIVLAAPTRGGFDLVAWIMPFAVLALAIVLTVWLLRHWRARHAQAHALATPLDPAAPLNTHLRDRIRSETTYEP